MQRGTGKLAAAVEPRPRGFRLTHRPRPLHRLSAEARQRNIRGIAYNTRFLILPWVQIPHLASLRVTSGSKGIQGTVHYPHQGDSRNFRQPPITMHPVRDTLCPPGPRRIILASTRLLAWV